MVSLIIYTMLDYNSVKYFNFLYFYFYRIGFSIAERLARDGAKVVISSRKQENVDSAVERLAQEGLLVTGVVCHVAKEEDREKLITEVKYLKTPTRISFKNKFFFTDC